MSDEIASRLQQVRQMYGLSQRELAKRAGLTNSSVSMIEQGRVSPSVSSLEKLLKGIPMTVRDFFNLDLEKQSQNFYRSFEMYQSSENGIDSYHLADDKPDKETKLCYQVYSPASGTGDAMVIANVECSGFVVQGSLEVTINNKCQQLDPGDGFFVDALSPYRFRNKTKKNTIVVISNHFPENVMP
ncbi:MAG: helix-turn-helix domain-containing protein [Pseudomonadota bacterium]